MGVTGGMVPCPEALAVGVVTRGRACLAVRADCQKMTSRPRAWVNTNCDRCSRLRSSTRSPRSLERRPTEPGERTAVRMAMWNADGSRGSMCGNGLRCLARLAADHGHVRTKAFDIG